jgi:uncharacterized protein (DUF2237 family)
MKTFCLVLVAAILVVECNAAPTTTDSEWDEEAEVAEFLQSSLKSGENNKNIYGEPLKLCSSSGMAMTGFTRNGKCQEKDDDKGSHHICIDLKSTVTKGGQPFNFCKATGQPDWCDQKMACFNDQSKKCPAENWCVCQWAFTGYIRAAGGCDMIQKIECESVNQAALIAYNKAVGENKMAEIDGGYIRNSIACLRKRCCSGAKKCVPTPSSIAAKPQKAGLPKERL